MISNEDRQIIQSIRDAHEAAYREHSLLAASGGAKYRGWEPGGLPESIERTTADGNRASISTNSDNACIIYGFSDGFGGVTSNRSKAFEAVEEWAALHGGWASPLPNNPSQSA